MRALVSVKLSGPQKDRFRALLILAEGTSGIQGHHSADYRITLVGRFLHKDDVQQFFRGKA